LRRLRSTPIAACVALLAAGAIGHAFLAPEEAAESAPAHDEAPAATPGDPRPPDGPAPPTRLEGRPDAGGARAAPAPRPLRPVVVPASVRFPAPTRSVSVEQRYQDSLAVLARVSRPADRAAMQRHLRRFLPPSTRWSLGGDGGRNWGDAVLGRIGTDRERVTDVEPLPVADVEASEARRVEQLENLRQRDAVGLLDAIHSGLAWIALHQAPDGALSEASATARCKELGHAPACVPAGREQNRNTEVAATALAVLAFLDFRDQDAVGLFEPYLAKSVQWLLARQRPDGSYASVGHWQIYTTAMAVMALGQAAAATGDPRIRAAVARGLRKFDETPGAGGGFRYAWGNDADLSVTAWVAQAVESARAAGVDVPPRLETNLRWFLDIAAGEAPRFRYRERGDDRPSLFPAGMLMGRILWPQIPDETLAAWTGWLRSPGWKRRPSLYTVYYGARMSILLERALRDPWRRWSLEVAESQVKKGSNAGAFPDALDGHVSRVGGTTAVTAFAVLTLEHALYLR
jgi:hypothetical protein